MLLNWNCLSRLKKRGWEGGGGGGDVLDNQVVKTTQFTTLNAKVNNSENKLFFEANLIRINQYNADNQNLEKKVEIMIKYTENWFSEHNCPKYKS